MTRRTWISRSLVAIVLCAATAYFARVLGKHEPLRDWLFFRYAGYWLLSLAFLAACLSSGHALVRRIAPAPLPLCEQLALDFATGVVLFAFAVFGCGLVHQLNAVTFALIPAALIAAGARPSWRYLRRAARRHRLRGGLLHGAGAIGWLAIAFGLAALGLIYFTILTPGNVAFDARWKHLALAQHYAAVHRIERFPEGWYPATAPQLASHLYTWALSLPVGRFFDKVELAQHLEFCAFSFSLIGIVALVRRLAPEVPSAASWAARFLFPGVLLYDSSLGGGADHLAAVFTAPMFLALFRAHKKLEVRHTLLLAIPISGAILTKFSSAFELCAFPVLAIALRSLWLAVRRRKQAQARAERLAFVTGPLACIGAGLALTSTLWLKNWIWYGDPLYPLLHRVFHARPYSDYAAYVYEHRYRAQLWAPELNQKGLIDSLKTLWTWSFEPNDWGRFHGHVPVFGSLLSLLLPAVPLLGKRARLWALLGAIHLGIFLWFWTNHQDRYLQTMMPWMAAATAAALGLLWRQGWLVRGPLAALVGVQVAWGGDVYFIPGHVFLKVPARASADLIAEGYQKRYDNRFDSYDFEKVAHALPRSARVLLHEQHPHLGLQRPAVHDWVPWQGGIDYAALGTPARIDALLRSFGVTHLLWSPDRAKGDDSLAGDLLFFAFAHEHTNTPRRIGGYWLAELPPEAPPAGAPFNDQVLFLGCSAAGLMDLKSLAAPSVGPERYAFGAPHTPYDEKDAASLVARAAFLVVESRCESRYREARSYERQFAVRVSAKGYELFIR